MAQTNPLSIPDSDGAAFLSDVNAKNAALFSSNSGPTAPSPTVAGMFWFDESVSPAVLRIRNSSNTAWIRIIDTADAAASRSALGATATGASVFTAADAAAARAALGAQVAGSYAPLPNTGGGVGTVININAGGVNFALPSGGTWWWSYNAVTGSGISYIQETGMSAGGTVIFPGGGSVNVARGWGWRIA
jgi:hypothetical protein